MGGNVPARQVAFSTRQRAIRIPDNVRSILIEYSKTYCVRTIHHVIGRAFKCRPGRHDSESLLFRGFCCQSAGYRPSGNIFRLLCVAAGRARVC